MSSDKSPEEGLPSRVAVASGSDGDEASVSAVPVLKANKITKIEPGVTPHPTYDEVTESTTTKSILSSETKESTKEQKSEHVSSHSQHEGESEATTVGVTSTQDDDESEVNFPEPETKKVGVMDLFAGLTAKKKKRLKAKLKGKKKKKSALTQLFDKKKHGKTSTDVDHEEGEEEKKKRSGSKSAFSMFEDQTSDEEPEEPHHEEIGFNDLVQEQIKLARILGSIGNIEKTDVPEISSTVELLTGSKRLEDFQRLYGDVRKVDSKRLDDTSTPPHLYEALQSNFLKTLVKTYLFRVVMTGTYDENSETLANWFQETVEDINSHCYSETITGILILYPNHFIHVVEGSEDTLTKFIEVMANQFEPTGLDWKLELRSNDGISVRTPILFKTVKTYVLGLFEIKSRGIPQHWRAEFMDPFKLVPSEVPAGGYRVKLFQFVKMSCISAITFFKLGPLKKPDRIDGQDKLEFEKSRHRYAVHRKRRSFLLSHAVPKPRFIDYIIKKNPKRKIQLRTLREHLDAFWTVPNLILSNQTDWPIPCRVAPYD